MLGSWWLLCSSCQIPFSPVRIRCTRLGGLNGIVGLIDFPCRLFLILGRPLSVLLLRPWVRCTGVSGRLVVDLALLSVIRISLESVDIQLCTVLPWFLPVGVVYFLRYPFLEARPRGRVLFLGLVLVLLLAS